MKRTFENLLENLKPTISSYDWFIDYEKVIKKAEEFKNLLEDLSKLKKSSDFKKDFKILYERKTKILNTIPLLLATRHEIITIYDGKFKKYNFKEPENTIDEYYEFITKSGLIDLLIDEEVDLFSYALGVEVGINTNARKSRTGQDMELLVEKFLRKGNYNYIKQANEKKIMFELGNKNYTNYVENNSTNANKTFDFAVTGKSGKLYLIETNFYSAGGSKLNETSRSYIKINDDLNKINNIEFIWITDGVGWLTTKGNLKEAYSKINNLLIISDLEEEKLKEIIK
jgi:type II restriction enzyme